MKEMFKDVLEVQMPFYAITAIHTLSDERMIFLYPLPVILYLVGALILLCIWGVICEDLKDGES